jgi:tRNA nucleotidyltransferase (CCA-adding enzyme)
MSCRTFMMNPSPPFFKQRNLRMKNYTADIVKEKLVAQKIKK